MPTYIYICRSGTKTKVVVVRVGEKLVNVKCFAQVEITKLENGKEGRETGKQTELIYCHIGNR